ncbi:MAG: cytochrome c-type biogenesis protein CcmH [Chloroflexi bacterium]|nr:cytochrome c-type biogenesis protein CcmH [Chloroflexota bacterium]
MKRIVFAIIALAFWAAPAWAQGPDAQALYTKLYCPLCGGVRLDACQLPVCEEMKTEIAQKVAAGQTDQQIITYYRQRWGDQVLGYPPAEGINWAAWLAPIALVLVGIVIAGRMAWIWSRARPAVARATGPTGDVSTEMAARIERELDE